MKLAQWSLPSTPPSDRGGHSAYEIVCGHIPQGPVDAFFKSHKDAKFMEPTSSVASLHEHLEKILDTVIDQLVVELEARQPKAEKIRENHTVLRAGNVVFLRRVPAALQGS